MSVYFICRKDTYDFVEKFVRGWNSRLTAPSTVCVRLDRGSDI